MASRLIWRITAPTIVVSLLLLSLGGLAAWYVHRLQQDSSKLLSDSVATLRVAEELEIVSRQLRYHLHEFMVTGEERHLQEISVLHDEARDWIEQAERLATTSRGRDLVASVRRGYEHFFKEVSRIANHSQRPKDAAVSQLINEVITEEILRPAHEFRDLNRDLMTQASRRNQMSADRLGLGLILLGSCGAVAGLVGGFGIARGVEQTVSERIRRSQLEALRAEQLASVGQLAAGMAHELRNPLTSIKMLIQSISDSDDGGTPRDRDLEVLNEEVVRLDDSIQTFLDFARPPTPSKNAFDVRSVVKRTVQLIASRAERQGICIETELPDEPLIVEADREQMRQVLLNLLLNAFDALPHGGTVCIRLKSDQTAEHSAKAGSAERRLTLEVADTGSGIPDELREQVFEPFVSTKETGTGLGLPICRRIVEEHGGDLSVANGSQGGAVFTVTLPLCSGAPENGEPQSADGHRSERKE